MSSVWFGSEFKTVGLCNEILGQSCNQSFLSHGVSDDRKVLPRDTKLQIGLRELGLVVEQALGPDASERRIGSVWAMRAIEPTPPAHAMYVPMLCVIAQGAKQLLVGQERYLYDAGRFLLNSITLPAAGHVIEASLDQPCLWTMIELDPAMVLSVIADGKSLAPPKELPIQAVGAPALDTFTLDAVVRLLRLFSSPKDFEFLSPLILREIVYRLLQTDQAPRLRQIVSQGGQAHRIVKVIEWLRENFDRPFSIEGLARECGMSSSTLHHQFKEVTAMSPLQFQKRMRLQEANRLMVSEGFDAASAGYRVGYEDPAYFNREYRKLFGAPPRRHVVRSLAV